MKKLFLFSILIFPSHIFSTDWTVVNELPNNASKSKPPMTIILRRSTIWNIKDNIEPNSTKQLNTTTGTCVKSIDVYVANQSHLTKRHELTSTICSGKHKIKIQPDGLYFKISLDDKHPKNTWVRL